MSPSFYSYTELRGRTRLWYALIIAVLALVGGCFYAAYRINQRLDAASQNINQRLDAVGARLAERDDQVKKTLQAANELIEATYWDNYASVQTTTVILRDIAEITRQVREGLLPNVTGLVGDMRDLVTSMKGDLAQLTGSSDKTLTALTAALNDTDALLKTLDAQVKAGAPEARETVQKVNKSLDHLDALLADPNIAQTLANVQAGTGSLASSAESLNQWMLPLRKKASMLKGVFKFVLSRFTYGFSK